MATEWPTSSVTLSVGSDPSEVDCFLQPGQFFVGSPDKVPYSEIHNESRAATGQVLQPHPVLLSVQF